MWPVGEAVWESNVARIGVDWTLVPLQPVPQYKSHVSGVIWTKEPAVSGETTPSRRTFAETAAGLGHFGERGVDPATFAEIAAG